MHSEQHIHLAGHSSTRTMRLAEHVDVNNEERQPLTVGVSRHVDVNSEEREPLTLGASEMPSGMDKARTNGEEDSWSESGREFCGSKEWPTRSEVWVQTVRLWCLGVPIGAMQVLNFSRIAVPFVFLGWLGKEELAAGSLAFSFSSVTGYSVLTGLCLGMEPICSQAFGAGHYSAMVHTLVRGILLLFVASIPIMTLWHYSLPVFLALGQDLSISQRASTYLKNLIPSLLGEVLFQPWSTFLRSSNRPQPAMWACAVATLLHVIITKLLVQHYGGAGAITSIPVFGLNMVILLFMHAVLSGEFKKLKGCFSLSRCFTGWSSLIALAIPSCLTICLEWWYFEILTFLSGMLPDSAVALGSMGITIQLASMSYSLLQGLSGAAGTLVGNGLGSNQPMAARHITLISIVIAAVLGMCSGTLFLTFRNRLGQLYTSDSSILAVLPLTLTFLALGEIGSWVQVTTAGILRGSSRPCISTVNHLFFFYCIGIPTVYLFTFALNMGVTGMWLALSIVQALLAIVSVIIAFRTNWALEAHKAQCLVGSSFTSMDKELLLDSGNLVELSDIDSELHSWSKS